MIKRFYILFILILAGILAGIFVIGNIIHQETINAKLYVIDKSMQRLIPIDCQFDSKSLEQSANEVVRKLIEGMDYNPKVMRVIPNVKNCMSVRVIDTTAVVNIDDDILDDLPDNRNHEILLLYQIVNSLTSLDGINTVEFLFDGEKRKDIFGGIDMRETFIPDYYL